MTRPARKAGPEVHPLPPAPVYVAAYSPKGGHSVHGEVASGRSLCGLDVVSMEEAFTPTTPFACRRCAKVYMALEHPVATLGATLEAP